MSCENDFRHQRIHSTAAKREAKEEKKVRGCAKWKPINMMTGDSFKKCFCSVGAKLQSKLRSYDNNAFTAYLSSPVKNSML